jgi:hypothetical protein
MAIFQRDLATAERIYIDQGSPDDAVRMYRQLLQWEDALRVADTYNLSDRHQIRLKSVKMKEKSDCYLIFQLEFI